MSKTKDYIIDWMRTNREVPPQLLPGYIDPQEVNMRRLVALEAGVPFRYFKPSLGPNEPIPSYSQYSALTKKQLLASVAPREKVYVVDTMAKKAGIEVVRLPPYHCEFNPIELVWGYAKGRVATRNVTYNLKRAMEVMSEECKKCDAEYWKKTERHCIKEEQKVLAGDVVLRSMVNRAVRNADDDLVILWNCSEESDSDSGSVKSDQNDTVTT